ncbi:MAG: hypothetical protein ACFE0Q_15270 [Anaerolineae bacterium]
MRRFFRWGVIFTVLFAIFSVVMAQQGSPENVFQALLRDLRDDIELLADRAFPGASRPDDWIGNTDFTSTGMLADLFIDNELLADEIFGGERPEGWIGVSSSVADIVARNIRHDLELSADEWLGEDLRPDEWTGGPPLYRCNQTLMNTAYLLDVEYNIRPRTPETVFDYCATVEVEIAEELIPAALGAATLEDVPDLLLAVRGDLERLANEVLGVNVRPGGWVNNLDVSDPAYIADLIADLELLADIILDNRRPPTWVSVSINDDVSALRNLRFNLESLTDRALGAGTRPNGWQGDSQLFRCAPSLQNLVVLISNTYPFSLPQTDAIGSSYCALVRIAANFVVENPPSPEVLEELTQDELAERLSAESRNAFTYDDPAAQVYYGVMPWGTSFRAWYRNFGESTMMFVSGDGFALFIDRRWTTLSEEVFRTLPTLEGVIPMTFCDASWCNGPAPTPTPTGSGPLLDIINSGTQPAESAPIVTPDGDTTGKQLVTWNNIRVNYLLFREDVGQVQVTLEICTDASQVVCEPVISLFNTATGQGVPVVSQSGGLNVYQLPYGYRTEFTIEGETLYSNDIWLNDPTLANTGQ